MNIRSKVTKYIRTSEARKIIGCDTREVRRLLREGIIRGIQDDNYVWYADKESVLKYVGLVNGIKYDNAGTEPAAADTIENYHEKFELTQEQKRAKAIIDEGKSHLLMLGKAGSGKTTFLKDVFRESKKNKRKIAVIAPSGIAAIEVEGVTIHSFFGFGVGKYESSIAHKPPKFKMDSEKRKLIENLDTIIIDEISMVRADLLDKVDWTLRIVRNNKQPFGGVQMVFVGDMRQLPPVVESSEIPELEKDNYPPLDYFFYSHAFQNITYEFVELSRVFRTEDKTLYDLLDKIRDKRYRKADIDLINSRYRRNAWKFADDDTVCMVTHKKQALRINNRKLDELSDSEPAEYEAQKMVKTSVPEEHYLLHIKKHAHVMFIQNKEGEYVNGTLGVVTKFDKDHIWVKIKGENRTVCAERSSFYSVDYEYDSENDCLEEKRTDKYRQFPLILAWAITVHKSQGQTFSKAVLDLEKSFACGQVYVALSRCRDLDGITLQSKINDKVIINDEAVDRFLDEVRKLNDHHEIELRKLPDARVAGVKECSDKKTFASGKLPNNLKKSAGIKLNKSELASIRAFKEGQTLEGIAKRRGLVRSTVSAHIANGIVAGIIDANELVDADVMARIVEAINLLGADVTRKGIFDLLDGEVQYEDINFVLAEKVLRAQH